MPPKPISDVDWASVHEQIQSRATGVNAMARWLGISRAPSALAVSPDGPALACMTSCPDIVDGGGDDGAELGIGAGDPPR
jgi:hypothetical protein